jgi:peptide/nickel transport system ATP-binding protein
MNETKKNLGMSIMLITHDLGVAAQTCDRLAVMHAGHIVEIANVDALFDNPQHPYTQGLLKAIPRADKKVRIEDIAGGVPNLIDPPKGCRFVRRCSRVINGLCEDVRPKMIETEKGHFVMCHLYKE